MRRTLVLILLFVGFIARAETPDAGFGMCMGVSTRCDLLPRGICFMQVGCANPAFGDRCVGMARQCTGFSTKNPCLMQRGCTWVKEKPAPKKT